jgi:NTE family protein
VLCALRDHGVDVRGFDVVIGSSAGSFVGARLLSGQLGALRESQLHELPRLVDRRLSAAAGNRLIHTLRISRRKGMQWLPQFCVVTAGLVTLGTYALTRGAQSAREAGVSLRARRSGAVISSSDIARLGDLAMVRRPSDNPLWVEHWRRELRNAPWPDRLVVTALDLATGALATFSRESGVSLARAVAASTAVLLLVSPVAIGERRYGDGGTASTTNADLAIGYDEVLVVAPLDRGTLDAEVEVLRAAGSTVHVVRPGESAADLGRGLMILDARRRIASLHAGYADGAAAVRAWEQGEAVGAGVTG